MNSGSLLFVIVGLTLLEGRTTEVVLRLEGRTEEVETRFEGAIIDVGTDRRVVDTWIRELPVDNAGVSAGTLDRGTDADGRAGRLVSRMSEIVREYSRAHSAFWMPSGQQ